MPTVNIRTLSRSTAAVLEQLQKSGTPVVVVSRNRPVAALMPLDAHAFEAFALLNTQEAVAAVDAADRGVFEDVGAEIMAEADQAIQRAALAPAKEVAVAPLSPPEESEADHTVDADYPRLDADMVQLLRREIRSALGEALEGYRVAPVSERLPAKVGGGIRWDPYDKSKEALAAAGDPVYILDAAAFSSAMPDLMSTFIDTVARHGSRGSGTVRVVEDFEAVPEGTSIVFTKDDLITEFGSAPRSAEVNLDDDPPGTHTVSAGGDEPPSSG